MLRSATTEYMHMMVLLTDLEYTTLHLERRPSRRLGHVTSSAASFSLIQMLVVQSVGVGRVYELRQHHGGRTEGRAAEREEGDTTGNKG